MHVSPWWYFSKEDRYMVGWDGHAFMRYSYLKRRRELNSDGVGNCPETSPERLTCTFDFY